MVSFFIINQGEVRGEAIEALFKEKQSERYSRRSHWSAIQWEVIEAPFKEKQSELHPRRSNRSAIQGKQYKRYSRKINRSNWVAIQGQAIEAPFNEKRLRRHSRKELIASLGRLLAFVSFLVASQFVLFMQKSSRMVGWLKTADRDLLFVFFSLEFKKGSLGLPFLYRRSEIYLLPMLVNEKRRLVIDLSVCFFFSWVAILSVITTLCEFDHT